jgi:hypothetical protein
MKTDVMAQASSRANPAGFVVGTSQRTSNRPARAITARAFSKTRAFEIGAVVLGSLLAGALYAWFAGEDINWDWRNYHEYSAFAWINGRLDRDVAPAGIQNFFNPLPYLPAYLLRHYAGAPYWGMLLGAIHGLNLALIYWCSRIVMAGAANRLAVVAAVLIAAFSPMALSEVGTSFADILTALPVIAGVGFILSASPHHRARYVIAGLLFGAAAGLKLTNMIFVIAAAVSLLSAARPVSALAWFALGGAAGGLSTGGAWAWALWQEFGNPVFPYYNSLFHSPEAPLYSMADMRFFPRNLWEAIAYPFYWVIGDHRSSEGPFRDPRFSIVIVLTAATVAASFFQANRMFTRRDKQFLLFFAVAYGVWLFGFSIHRYAVALELLTAPLIVLLLCRLLGAFQGKPFAHDRPASANFATLALAFAIAVWSQPADWMRRPWSDPYRPELSEQLPPAATYFLIEKALGYIVPQLGSESRAYQVADILMPIVPGGSFDHRIRAGLANPLWGGVWALHLRGSETRQCLLDPYGLQIDTTRPCAIIQGAEGAEIEACRLRRSLPAKQASTC